MTKLLFIFFPVLFSGLSLTWAGGLLPSAMWKGIHSVGVMNLSVGLGHNCVTIETGELKCWGQNGAGQLGYGNASSRGSGPGQMGDRLPAVDLGSGRVAVQISAGNNHSCAVLDNGGVKCWGSSAVGQLGYGDTASRGNAAGQMGDGLPFVDLGTGRTALQVATGFNHSCAILDNGGVKCWGSGANGALGYGDTNNRGDGAGEMGDALPFVDLGTGRTARQIILGQSHTCALLDNSRVKCWGLGSTGALGKGDSASRGDGAGEMGDALPFVDLGTGRTVLKIASGWAHTCALLDNSQIKCWGNGSGGRLGYGDTVTRGTSSATMGNNLLAVDLGTGRTAVNIASGGTAHTCAILDNGGVKCWGEGAHGKLGYGNVDNLGDGAGEMGDALPFVDIGTGRKALQIGLGQLHTCALLENSQVKCWGQPLWGQLGYGDNGAAASRGDAAGEMGDNLPFVDLGRARSRLLSWAEVGAGGFHSCGRTLHGKVKCWGTNNVGQLGYGDINDRGDAANEIGDNLPFVDLGTGRTALKLEVGEFHNCVILDNRGVKCWGSGSNGQLGYGDTIHRGDGAGEMGDSLPFVDLGTGRTATQLAVGNGHTCVLLDNSQVKCWGSSGNGQLGYGSTAARGDGPGEMGDSLPFVDLGTGRTAVHITAGSGHTCALLDNSRVKCWGNGGVGQLGYEGVSSRGWSAGQMGDSLPFVEIGTARTVKQIMSRQNHTCALLDNSQVKCWGNGTNGRLGSGDTAMLGDGVGEMGDSLPTIDLGTGRSATKIITGNSHTCALLDNSQLKCWGGNVAGQLGYGDTNDRGDAAGEMGDSLPSVDLGTTAKALQFSAGGFHTCALMSNSQIKCWGAGSSGGLGYGNSVSLGDGPGEMGNNLPVVLLGTKERSP